jgi:DNA modification methylase
MIEPYYADDLTTIYCGDSLDILPDLPVASFHAVVTDPPYVVGALSAGTLNAKSGGWADMMNSALWFVAWYRQVASLLRDDGSLWTFCNWRSLPVVLNAAHRADFPVTSVAVWDKDAIGTGGRQGLRPSYELVALMCKPGFAVPDRGMPDVWRHKYGSHRPNGHPAEKPEGLITRILDACGLEPGARVLDPFVGSGTTAVAARRLGLPCVAIEADEKWCDVTVRRLGEVS